MWREPSARLAAALCAAFVAASIVAGTAAAHGGGTPQLSDTAAGPYRLFVWTQPEPWRAGEAHLTVAVILPTASSTDGQGQPVMDAAVTVALAGPGGEALQVDAVPPALLSNPTYEADTRLPAAGPWQVTVEVAGQEGAGAAQFSVEVLPARTVNWALLAGGAVILVAIVGMAGLRARRSQPVPSPRDRRRA